MQNPFETGHIKNYLLLYASVVVIMVLFFIASTLFHDMKDVEPKVFLTENEDINTSKVSPLSVRAAEVEDRNSSSRFKLLEKAY